MKMLREAGTVAQLVEHLCTMREALGLIPSLAYQGVMEQLCSLSPWVVEAG